MLTYKGKELEEFLERTKNPYLKEYRREYHSHPFRILFKEILAHFKRKILAWICKGDIKKSYKRRNSIDKKWIIEEINEYRERRRMGERTNKVVPLLLYNQLMSIDEKIALTIFSLNKLGFKTNFCCQGHDFGYYKYYSYISLAPNHKFPSDLLKHLEDDGVKYRLKLREKNNKNFGDSLYSENIIDNETFVNSLNKWAVKQNNLTLSELKKSWKV